MSRGFHQDSSKGAHAPYRLFAGELAASTAFQPGDALEVASGVLSRLNAQTDKVFGVFQDLKVPKEVRAQPTKYTSTTAGEMGLILSPTGIFQTFLDGADAPLVNGLGCISGTTASAIKFTSPFGSGENSADFDLGVLFCNGEQRTVASGAFSGTTYTLTLNRALTNTPAVGDLVYVVSFNIGFKPKFSSSAPYRGVSTAIADANNGSGFLIREVNLNPKASPFGPYVTGEFLAY